MVRRYAQLSADHLAPYANPTGTTNGSVTRFMAQIWHKPVTASPKQKGQPQLSG